MELLQFELQVVFISAASDGKNTEAQDTSKKGQQRITLAATLHVIICHPNFITFPGGTFGSAAHCFPPTKGIHMTAPRRVPIELPKQDSSERLTDTAIFQYLGMATMLCWTELPFKARDQVLNQANDIVGVRPPLRLRDEIEGLLLRHRKS
jgi:hypothetical protein